MVRLIVTRVQPQAQQWADRFAAHGDDAVVLPLIEVRGLADVSAVSRAWLNLPNYKALMFVSRHAVDYFFLAKPASVPDAKALAAMTTRWWATGPGTAHALLDHGVPVPRLDTPPEQAGQFDSEALWQQVHAQVQPGDKVLIVRGDSVAPDGTSVFDNDQGVGREWLAEHLRQSGAQVDFVVAYQRGAPFWTDVQCALAQSAATDGSVWLFSSAEALGHLQSLLPGQDWSAARAVATHPRIAAAARGLGFGVVTQTRPTWEEVRASVESLT
ncbi:MAG: uroporphyrinogen-III synthase [Rhodoferax sp.]|uniref:uroporphyrinogen-III synthase n=1 Tax=Rhodoferax sp. TaxID=50421 RepID=UPI0027252441|nr:uroporphyrinogen-III synthase [Rhodoferax sp.]MDO9142949.1 uroporphyrinogen-III synthase [Rhodoferax sp.]MDP1530132.1 uroporphyrinogen-III synthase [Rhodoferax sp.]MDP1943496.1 uroporphyrinogen-III synthase [Rhodoferax sp.]MDP3865839.1 uroporphyrinogen-III synthase [Rhodoferax sp.]